MDLDGILRQAFGWFRSSSSHMSRFSVERFHMSILKKAFKENVNSFLGGILEEKKYFKVEHFFKEAEGLETYFHFSYSIRGLLSFDN